MRTAKPVHIGKIIKDYENLMRKGTERNPVDVYEKNNALEFMVGEWQAASPKEAFKAFLRYQKLQGLA